MRIFVTGATGFVGHALVASLQQEGHTVQAWVRSEQEATAKLGGTVPLLPLSSTPEELVHALSLCDGVISLAGEPIAARRWTDPVKKELLASRVGLTDRLVAALMHADPRPRVLISASAVGAYGNRGKELLSEESLPGTGFLADVCIAWEAAALRAATRGVRVVTPRFGLVLGREGGAFARLAPIFRAGFGGPIAGGSHYMPWIHLEDAVSFLTTALQDDRYVGPLNVVSPTPVTQGEFAQALGVALHRPTLGPVPAFAVRLGLGEAACVLLDSQRVSPAKAEHLGFVYRFPELSSALHDLVEG